MISVTHISGRVFGDSFNIIIAMSSSSNHAFAFDTLSDTKSRAIGYRGALLLLKNPNRLVGRTTFALFSKYQDN